MTVSLNEESDRFVWILTLNGLFTVKSMYENIMSVIDLFFYVIDTSSGMYSRKKDIMSDHTTFLRKYLWKVKIPLKIKIFMWFFE
jgi:hypothetical protein